MRKNQQGFFEILNSVMQPKAPLHHYSLQEPQAISNALYGFYQILFKEQLSLSEKSIQSFLDKVPLPNLNDNQALESSPINENELLKALTSMDNDKRPGYDDITK